MSFVRLAIGSTFSGRRRQSTSPSFTSNTRPARGGFRRRTCTASPPARGTSGTGSAGTSGAGSAGLAGGGSRGAPRGDGVAEALCPRRSSCRRRGRDRPRRPAGGTAGAGAAGAGGGAGCAAGPGVSTPRGGTRRRPRPTHPGGGDVRAPDHADAEDDQDQQRYHHQDVHSLPDGHARGEHGQQDDDHQAGAEHGSARPSVHGYAPLSVVVLVTWLANSLIGAAGRKRSRRCARSRPRLRPPR